MEQISICPAKPETLHKLKKAIHGKYNYIPLCRLDDILQHLNPCRRYFIQATRDPQKFLNIISSETIVTDDSRIFSETSPIYGKFTPGRFTNLTGDKTITDGTLDEATPAAALKSTFGNRYFADNSVSYTLVIYEPDTHACSFPKSPI